jgi:hypothetical protein
MAPIFASYSPKICSETSLSNFRSTLWQNIRGSARTSCSINIFTKAHTKVAGPIGSRFPSSRPACTFSTCGRITVATKVSNKSLLPLNHKACFEAIRLQFVTSPLDLQRRREYVHQPTVVVVIRVPKIGCNYAITQAVIRFHTTRTRLCIHNVYLHKEVSANLMRS